MGAGKTFALTFVALSFVIYLSGGKDDQQTTATTPVASGSVAATPNTPARASSVEDAAAAARPAAQTALLRAVEASRSAYRSARNDMQKGGARAIRKQGICSAIRGTTANAWLGKITTLSSNSDGRGVLTVEIGPKVYVKTWNNALSDIVDQTLLDPASPVFAKAASMSVGAWVWFYGDFVADETDCIRESSMTLNGSMTAPEFIFRFRDIEPATTTGTRL